MPWVTIAVRVNEITNQLNMSWLIAFAVRERVCMKLRQHCGWGRVSSVAISSARGFKSLVLFSDDVRVMHAIPHATWRGPALHALLVWSSQTAPTLTGPLGREAEAEAVGSTVLDFPDSPGAVTVTVGTAFWGSLSFTFSIPPAALGGLPALWPLLTPSVGLPLGEVCRSTSETENLWMRFFTLPDRVRLVPFTSEVFILSLQFFSSSALLAWPSGWPFESSAVGLCNEPLLSVPWETHQPLFQHTHTQPYFPRLMETLSPFLRFCHIFGKDKNSDWDNFPPCPERSWLTYLSLRLMDGQTCINQYVL